MSLELLRSSPFFDASFVSRETWDKLETYQELLEKWSAAYNLVQKETLGSSGKRHFLDSLQMYPRIDKSQTLLDVGSGAGFPGMVLAMVGCTRVTLVECNLKKVLFLEEVARQTSTSVKILHQKWQDLQGDYQQVTARAFSNLSHLLEILRTVSRETKATGWFLKGASWKKELEQCQKQWQFEYELFPSITESESKIIKIKGVSRR